jgi:C4-dicarboxylate-specific signal transduction histidine kinase
MKPRKVEQQIELTHPNRFAAIEQLSASIVHEVSQPIAATIINAQAALRFTKQFRTVLLMTSVTLTAACSNEDCTIAPKSQIAGCTVSSPHVRGFDDELRDDLRHGDNGP